MSVAVARTELDCFFSPSVYTYFPLPPGLRAVVTIHDTIAERFPELTVPSRRARLFWNVKVWLALTQARQILTVSDYAARDIARIHGIAAARITVALEAPASEYTNDASAHDIGAVARRIGLPQGASWFTYVGGFNPHKNVPLIIRAHAALARELGLKAPHLALVGTLDRDVFHGDQQTIRAAIAEERTESLVHWTGFLSDEDLAKLHAGAVALLIPSECEGFGLPAVEAAACGTPAIATTESPLPELLEGGGIFVVPGHRAQLLDAMRRLATDTGLRLELGAVASKRARSLTWDRGAQACLTALRGVIRE
ncbi:MAG: glycosyltransferase family 4 protein [Gemmatimonadaceae bacterium]|nr:glycosyltransferase family 4 protein [Gemmatimonadaceae bacterium]